MLKFKLSLLLNNTKFKVAMAVLLLTAIVTGLVFIPKNKAGNISSTVSAMANSSGVTLNGTTVYKIEKDGSAQGYDNLFCIESGAHLVYQTYTNPIEISQASSYFKNYNSMMWLVNNMYAENAVGINGISNETARNIEAMNFANLLTAQEVKNGVKEKTGVDYSGVTSQKIYELRNKNLGASRPMNAFKLVGQFVMWNYTYNPSANILAAYDSDPNLYFGGTDLTTDQQITLKYVYYSLKYLADKNADNTTNTNQTGYVTLDKSQAKLDTTNYLAGPYYIKCNGMTMTSYKFNDGDYSTDSGYPAHVDITNVDDTTERLGANAFEIKEDGSFYINLANNKNLKSMSFSIDCIVGTINTQAYVMDGGNQQNLLALNKEIGATSLRDEKRVDNKGSYSVDIVKVDEDGKTVITSSEAKFTVNGTEKTTEAGKLSVENNKEITDVEVIDSYEIVETAAPEGYNAFEGTLKLDVGFKLEGITYLIDEEKVNVSGATEGVTVVTSEDKTNITVYIPNKHQPGKYTVELIKVDDNDDIIKSPAVFEINGKQSETVNGVITIAKNVEVNDETTELKYVIKEIKAPETYELFKETITLSVRMKKTENGYALDLDTVKVDVTGNATGVGCNIVGNTIQLYIPNQKKKFDMSLRKSITKIDDVEVEESRLPVINNKSIEMLQKTETASYYHTKKSLTVKEGSLVEYTIRVYNEGEIESYAKKIVDFLPFGLRFVKLSDDTSSEYTTTTEAGSRIVNIDYNGNKTVRSLREFIGKEEVNVTSDYYQEVKVICRVEKSEVRYITSRAEILNYGYYDLDENNNKVWKEAIAKGNVDIDSVQNTIMLDLKLDTWYENAKEREYYNDNWELVVDNNYYPGVEDDDDFETVEILKEFDLSLRKFITGVNGTELAESREPQVDLTKLISGESTTATYTHSKEPVEVDTSDIVTYTLRIYNEGEVDGYAVKIMDDIPEGLEFVENSDNNAKYKWLTYKEANSNDVITDDNSINYDGKIYVLTNNVKDAKLIVTDYLSESLIKAFDNNSLDYKDVKVDFKVIEPNTSDRIMINYAQITEHKDSERNTVTDRDSTPNVWIENEDDQDIEKVKVRPRVKEFDLSLRKFITGVNGTAIAESREPQVDLTKLVSGESTTATYKHSKEPVEVETSDVVTYTLRIYNEGEVDGYAVKVMDDIPEGLEFVADSEVNKTYKWVLYKEVSDNTANAITYNNKKYVETSDVKEAKLVVTDYLSNSLIKAFDNNSLDYKDLKVEFKVVEPNTSSRVLINYAQITEHKDSEGNPITDRDSTPNVWIENEDDQDIEKVKVKPEEIVKEFDLSLRKFITEINGEKLADSREPQVDLTKLVSGESTTATYTHSKTPVEVKSSDIVTYTLRIYNEGEVDGYAVKVMDDIPEGLEFVADSEVNKTYKWVLYKEVSDNTANAITYNNKKYVETSDVKEAKLVVTDYLSNSLINAFDGEKLDYKDVKVEFKVVEPDTSDRILTNFAQITEHKDSEGNPVTDRDSTPNVWIEKEDDQDIENIKLQPVEKEFDLSLRKFITEVNGKELAESREPQVDLTKLVSGESTTATYKHSKEPVEVETSDVVTYTLRIYNEGEVDGYAVKVMDDIPEGLEFVADSEVNKTYKWVLYKEATEADNITAENAIKYNNKIYVVTEDVKEAKLVVTDYLSKSNGTDNLIKAFDGEKLDYKDVKVEFKVVEPTTSDRILINYAQITENTDSEGNPVIDRDSTPNEWIENEDDQDIEKVKVRYFDLSLLKWVSKAIVLENGEKTVTETGHTGYERPEPVVKVDLKNTSLDNVEVKFEYVIRVTNEGEIAGYAKEISDYIPEGLKFVAADNAQWKEVDGKIVTRALEDTLLQPGEYADVTVILTWINGKDNLGLKINTAEISEDYNEYHTRDIDSTPNNKKEGEDDIDTAPVILTVRTGKVGAFFGIAIVTLSIITAGIVVVKKKVLDVDFK